MRFPRCGEIVSRFNCCILMWKHTELFSGLKRRCNNADDSIEMDAVGVKKETLLSASYPQLGVGLPQ